MPPAADTAGVTGEPSALLDRLLWSRLCGLAGANLALVHVRFFTEGMSTGKGCIAPAALIFGKWHPIATILACLLFGATKALQPRIQAFNLQSLYQFLVMLSHVIALLALISTPYTKESKQASNAHRW